jgi:hypothetical protein
MWLLNATAVPTILEYCAVLVLRRRDNTSTSRRITADITVGGGGYEVNAFFVQLSFGQPGPSSL